ncbi:MAG: NOP5/NOP56 family protein [Candidatus Woesearchaeota archaeon]
MELAELKKKQVEKVKEQIRASIGPDDFILQAVASIEELDRLADRLTRRVREWCMLHIPEASQGISDNRFFLDSMISKQPKQVLTELGVTNTSGVILSGDDIQPVLELAVKAKSLYASRDRILVYLETIIAKHAPNLSRLAGPTIAAKLLRQAGSLKQLALMPASTIQVLGAEKALFRHLVLHANPPKHGFIAMHQLVQSAPLGRRGRMARALADKLSICAKLDYFKGEFLAPKYEEELRKLK